MHDRIVVDIADMKSSSKGGELITYALGSCIGVSVFDPVAKCGALLHFMLPDSKLDDRKAKERPCMFADTGLLMMFKDIERIGGNHRRLLVRAAGGSNIMDPNGTFNIGKRNYLALKKTLWQYNLLIKSEDVGGCHSRTMILNTESGVTSLRYSGDREERPL